MFKQKSIHYCKNGFCGSWGWQRINGEICAIFGIEAYQGTDLAPLLDYIRSLPSVKRVAHDDLLWTANWKDRYHEDGTPVQRYEVQCKYSPAEHNYAKWLCAMWLDERITL